MSINSDVVCLMKGITKQFPGVKALDDVDLEVRRGEVMALVGENGAGKSTLMKVLAGLHSMDSGQIFIDDVMAKIDSPAQSRDMGISFIHQELNLAPNMSVAENIFLGREKPSKKFFLDRGKTNQEAKRLLDMVGLKVSTGTLVKNLSIAQRQMVEVARALSMNSSLIVMDEPTSSLTDNETDVLLSIIKRLKQRGVSIVFISHRLKEVFKISDRITVLRDGKNAGVFTTADVSEEKIIQVMVGREIKDLFDKHQADIGMPVLEIKNLSTENFLEDINFHVRAGEILGFAGLVGAGRTEVMQSVFGIDTKRTGDVYINGQKVDIKDPYDAIKAGIGYVPEDRKLQGLILQMTVKENITLANLEQVSHRWLLDNSRELKVAGEYIEKLDIKTPHKEQKVVNLSGGNQQKVVIAKWLAIKPRVLILDEPTRGIDVGAKREIHYLMSQLAGQGVAIIMISSELPEVLGMSDRIIIMHEGRIKGELTREEASQEKIMKMAISQNL